jgi:hypothetical protein
VRGRLTAPAILASSIVIAASLAAAGCGKKGPPLPPLIKLPVAPDEFLARRRGDTVYLQFIVPGLNTDRSRPANIQRVEVYAFTGVAPASDAEFLKRAAKVAEVEVKAPKDPDQTTDPDEEPGEQQEVEPPEGAGVDQGTVATAEDRLTAAALTASAEPPATTGVPVRTYLGVGISTNGKSGGISKRVAVPLVPPPPPPPSVSLTYTERAVTIAWTAPPSLAEGGPAGLPAPSLAYHVYDVTPAPGKPAAAPVALTMMPVEELQFNDDRMTWGATRCYAVRALAAYGPLAIESDEARPPCITLKDTFPPARPQGLTSVASERAISLIWEPNGEPDLDGYIVLRGTAAGNMTPISGIVRETTFRDTVAPGTRFFYAVRALDTVGNASPDSTAVEETSR